MVTNMCKPPITAWFPGGCHDDKDGNQLHYSHHGHQHNLRPLPPHLFTHLKPPETGCMFNPKPRI